MSHAHDDEVADLAKQIANTLNQLPDDGKERQLTVTIGGSNHGTVVLGSQITINSLPKRALTHQEMEVKELRQLRGRYSSEIRAAQRKRWFSPPSIIMLLMIIFLFCAVLWHFIPLLQGVPIRFLLSEPPAITSFPILLTWTALFFITGIFFDKKRKVQDRLIRNNKELIESIDVELSRKGF